MTYDVFSVVVQLAWLLRSLLGGRRNLRAKVFSNRATAVACSPGDLADAQFFVEQISQHEELL